MRTKVNAFLRGSMRVMGLAVVAGMMAACEKSMIGEEMEALQDANVNKNAALKVVTRSGDNEATVSYPVHVYVFQKDVCKAAQTIGDEGQTLNIALTEGTYSVYAVGGASTADYVLPVASDALTTSAIELREGKSHGDLMAAKATVTLADGEANTVTLGMERRTMLLQSVVLKKIPTAATAVSVSVSPLWQSLTVGGNYSGTDGSYSVALEKQSDGRTWQLPAPVGEGPGVGSLLLPPSSSPASITVRITTPSGTRSYTYSTSNELEAGYKINIEGTYTEAVGVSLTGTIEGATWLGERTISFNFNESGSSASDDSNEDNGSVDDGSAVVNPANFPAVGDTYQGCYVLASVVATDGESAELTLLSPNERSVSSDSDANNALATLGVDGISDWSIPTKDQIDAFYAAKDDITPAPDRQRYLWQDGTTMKQRFMSDGSDSKANYNYTIFLRPVATVSITKD